MVGLGVLVYDTVHADPGVRHHRCRLTTHVAVSGVLWRQQHYYHQQYLSDAKKSNGYCGVGGTGVFAWVTHRRVRRLRRIPARIRVVDQSEHCPSQSNAVGSSRDEEITDPRNL